MNSAATKETASTQAGIAFWILWGATFSVLLYLFGFVFFQTPTAQAAAGGIAQKIFYFHVPSAYGLYASGILCFIGSAAFLLKPTDGRNALAQAGAECAVLFGLLMLTSGPLWAKKAWGVYWVWEPRLTTTLLTTLLYSATLVLRSFGVGGHGERKFAAAIGVLGTINLPIVHYAVQKWGGNHPQVISGQGGGLRHPDMWHALIAGFIAMALLSSLLLWLRTSLAKSEARLSRLEQAAVGRGALE